LDELASHIPPGVPLLATDPFAAKLSDREFISLPFAWINLSQQDWLKVDQSRAEWIITGDPDNLKAGMTGLNSIRPWKIVAEGCKFFVAKRAEAPQSP
jgi:hypothetical protein